MIKKIVLSRFKMFKETVELSITDDEKTVEVFHKDTRGKHPASTRTQWSTEEHGWRAFTYGRESYNELVEDILSCHTRSEFIDYIQGGRYK